MATINSITFDEAAYNPGATITMTVNYVPDTASVVPTTFTATVNVVNSSGTTVTSSTADFVVNESNSAGDTLAVSDSGNHTWTAGSTTANADGSLSQAFTTTA